MNLDLEENKMDIIDPRFFFGGAIFGTRKGNIQVRAREPRIMALSPRKVVDYFRTTLSHDGRIGATIRRARDQSLRISQTIPLCGVRIVSEDNHKLLGYIIMKYEWKVTQIVHNKKCSSIPMHVILYRITDRFVAEWNNLIKSLDGQWILHYGHISYAKLVIQNTSHFVELLETGLRQKLLKNFFQDKDVYAKFKETGRILAVHLKLHHDLMLARSSSTTTLRRFSMSNKH